MGIICFTCLVVSLMPRFDIPKLRPVRGALFVFEGVSIICVFIALIFRSEGQMYPNVTVWVVGGYVFI